ncbi:heat shock transcription factor, putative [Entamoeba histolytica HM-1:IMSS-B]|uniref:Heat shock transcription factor, putative n=6 Tax=Entamoeba histolytica TaxID=5759 RepID=C4LUF2_ENTH1|nr:heat shock transcription factor, putative [Entamoeba histolytica HM-1:IMSS]EMD45865.1 heat shock transcription factor, putative [Entamoeba histolytica KU27]EMH76520.1 heat shock transcription factor, putative [Entamoeba histolytica HM-1:IMSS-B]EMS13260.1 heat shock transcription factor, putative [Entamoeba histolytica HM-3:IMSS]ENY64392.1 heat shock transcription factor, putative [Entamoeba histolytica HM-1:IMSS-A]GAT92238.1 heat shock transcription factor putative [Entamoeba histolytica]|eukprot:XP_655877.1 heat shock transcription factor, putative [Entamoeba histolytica HM-1:IMSS]
MAMEIPLPSTNQNRTLLESFNPQSPEPTQTQNQNTNTNTLGYGEAPGTLEFLHNCAPFIAKLYLLVNSPQSNSLICWSEPLKGTAICVNNPVQFAQEILPKHFKHSNIASFVRQLNIYGFHKLDCKEGLCFKHEFFQRAHPELLEKIKRKKNKKGILAQTLQPFFPSNSLSTEPPKRDSDELLNVASLRIDINKLQNQVEEIKGELSESKMKWTNLTRRIDQLDQMFNLLYSNYSGIQNNTQLNTNSNSYFQNPSLSLYPSPRRVPDFQSDDGRHREQN